MKYKNYYYQLNIIIKNLKRIKILVKDYFIEN